MFLSVASSAQDSSQQTPVIDLDKVVNGLSAPKAIYNPEPEYTDRARKKKIRGSVVLSIVVTDEGKVRDARVVAGLAKDLDQQALKAVSTWKFEPATKDGKPVPVRIKVEVDFKIY
jgi:TonB family protein